MACGLLLKTSPPFMACSLLLTLNNSGAHLSYKFFVGISLIVPTAVRWPYEVDYHK